MAFLLSVYLLSVVENHTTRQPHQADCTWSEIQLLFLIHYTKFPCAAALQGVPEPMNRSYQPDAACSKCTIASLSPNIAISTSPLDTRSFIVRLQCISAILRARFHFNFISLRPIQVNDPWARIAYMVYVSMLVQPVLTLHVYKTGSGWWHISSCAVVITSNWT